MVVHLSLSLMGVLILLGSMVTKHWILEQNLGFTKSPKMRALDRTVNSNLSGTGNTGDPSALLRLAPPPYSGILLPRSVTAITLSLFLDSQNFFICSNTSFNSVLRSFPMQQLLGMKISQSGKLTINLLHYQNHNKHQRDVSFFRLPLPRPQEDLVNGGLLCVERKFVLFLLIWNIVVFLIFHLFIRYAWSTAIGYILKEQKKCLKHSVPIVLSHSVSIVAHYLLLNKIQSKFVVCRI